MPDDTAYSAWSGTGASTPSSAGADRRLDQEFASLAPELSRRIGTILDTIQREADKMLDQARMEAQRQVDYGRREADELISTRRLRLAQLSDALIARSETVITQLDEAERVRQSFARMLQALADAADRIAEEARATASIPLAPPPQPPPAPLGLQEHAPLFASTTAAAAPPPPPPPAPPMPPPAPAPVHEPAEPPSAAPEPAPTPPPPPAPAAAPPPAAAPAMPAAPAAYGTAPVVDRAWVEARQAAIHMAAAGNTRGQVETQLRDFLGVAEPGALLDQVFGAGTVADARVPWAIAPATPLRPRR